MQLFNPVYRKIEADLRQQIHDGVWRQGVALPSRRELAGRYNVETSTIQKAIRALLDDGTLIARPGSGTFVASRRPNISSTGPAVDSFIVPVPSRATSTHTIGVVASIEPKLDLEHQPPEHWHATVLQAFDRSFSDEQGITLHFQNRWSFNPDWTTIGSVAAASRLVADGIDALVIVMPRPNELDAIYEFGNRARLPLVVVADYPVDRMIPHVRYDVSQSGYLAAGHLLRQGYTNLSYFAPFKAAFADSRLAGIRQAMGHLGLLPSTLTVSDTVDHGDVFSLDHERIARVAAPAFLAQPKEKWGIIAASDPCAYGLIEAASAAGLVAGKDFAIIGFDDRPRSRELGLSSVHPPVHQMGIEAGRLVRLALLGKTVPLEVLLQSLLVARKSTRAFSGAI